MSGPYLNAAYYQNLPADEVNWAQLAQQWIAMRETQAGPPPGPMIRPPPPVGMGQFHRPGLLDYNRQDAMGESQQPWRNWNQPRLNQPLLTDPISRAPWPVPNVVRSQDGMRLPMTSSVEPRNTYEFSAIDSPQTHYGLTTPQQTDWSRPPLAATTYFDTPPLSHPPNMADPFGLTVPTVPVPSALFPGGIHDVDYRKMMAPDKDLSIHHTPILDVQKRKSLPSWIREGLEKVEREKQRQKEKEELERMAKEEAERDAEEMRLTGKSKFESDSDSEDEAESAEPESPPKVTSPGVGRRSASKFHSPSPQRNKSAEELKEEMLGLLRKWMTEILMEVTNEETERIAQEVYKSERGKAPAKMLKSSSALAALSILGSGYDSDTNAEDEDESGHESAAFEQNSPAAIHSDSQLAKSHESDAIAMKSEESAATVKSSEPEVKRNGDGSAHQAAESQRKRSRSPQRKTSSKEKKKRRKSSTSSDSSVDSREKRRKTAERRRSPARDSRRSKSPRSHRHHRQSSRERRRDRQRSKSKSRSPTRHRRRRSRDRR